MLGGRWKPNVLWKIYEGVDRYGDIKRSIPGISEKVLYERLRELEEDNLVIRINNTTATEVAIVYNITDLGMQLIPILKELWKWGDIAKTDIFA